MWPGPTQAWLLVFEGRIISFESQSYSIIDSSRPHRKTLAACIRPAQNSNGEESPRRRGLHKCCYFATNFPVHLLCCLKMTHSVRYHI